MLRRVNEVEGIETVGDLRRALASVDDNMPICDGVGEPLILTWYEDKETGDPSIEVG